MPPPKLAVLPETVDAMTVTLPSSARAPPPMLPVLPSAELPLMVLLARVISR